MKNQIIQVTEDLFGWLLETLVPNIKLKKRINVPLFIYLHATSISFSDIQVNEKVKQNISSYGVSQSSNVSRETVTRLLNSQILAQSESNNNFYFATILALKSAGLLQSYNYSAFIWPFNVQQLKCSGLLQSYIQLQPVYYISLVSSAISQSFLEETSKSHLVNLKSKALAYSSAEQQVNQPYLKNIYLQAKGVCTTDEQVSIKRQFNIYSTVISTSINSETGYYIQRELW